MSAIEKIKKAVEDYEKLTLDYPNIVHISHLTWFDIERDFVKDVIVCSCPKEMTLFGMTIDTNNRLPKGIVVVGGVMCDLCKGE